MRALMPPLVLSATLIASSAVAFPIETTTALNLRSGPSSGYPVLATMPRGEIVHLEFCQGAWCRVQFRATAGWASADHLARIPGRPFPWEGAERAALAYPFDRPAFSAARPPGDVLREAAPRVATPSAVDPAAESPAASRAIEEKVKPVVSQPTAPAEERRDRLAREGDADRATDPLRRIGPRGAGGRDVL